MHWTEHPALEMNASDACERNEHANLAILNEVTKSRTDRPRLPDGTSMPEGSYEAA